MDNSIRATGTEVNYYFVCRRKLWLFSHQITMEHASEAVEIGKLVHEDAYKRKRKEIELDGIKIDFYDKTRGLIHEVKKSRAVKEAHIWQVRYYIYAFRKLGLNVAGEIDYPLLRRREKVELQTDEEPELERILEAIRKVKEMPEPPETEKMKICGKCSYYELCFV